MIFVGEVGGAFYSAKLFDVWLGGGEGDVGENRSDLLSNYVTFLSLPGMGIGGLTDSSPDSV